MEKLGEYSPNALVYVLAHKMDLIKDNRNTVGVDCVCFIIIDSRILYRKGQVSIPRKSHSCVWNIHLGRDTLCGKCLANRLFISMLLLSIGMVKRHSEFSSGFPTPAKPAEFTGLLYRLRRTRSV